MFVIARLNVVISQFFRRILGRAARASPPFEAFSGEAVIAAAADRVQLFVEHLANFVVRKSERVSAVARDQLRSRRFVQGVERRVFLSVAGDRHQFIEGKSFTEHGGGAQRLVRFPADAVQPIANRFFHALWDNEFADLAPLPPPAFAPHRPLLHQRFQNFLDEERIALGLTMDGVAEIGADAFAEQRAKLRRSFRRVETSQDDAGGQSFAVPFDQGLGERVGAIELCVAIGADDERASFAELSKQLAEEPESSAVSPMQVVSVEEQSLIAGETLKYLRHCVEEKQPFVMRLQLGTFRKWAEAGINLGRKFRDLRSRIAERGA